MSEENGGGSATGRGGWVEGGPVESLTPDAARAEIKQIERDGRFAGKESETQGFLDRKAMLERRAALYRKAGPVDVDMERALDPDMYQTLKEQGVTVESLQKAQEAFEAKETEDLIAKAKADLAAKVGGKEPALAVINNANLVIREFASKEQIRWIADVGLGLDVPFIIALGEVGRMLKERREQIKEKKRRKG